ncbi:Vam6/Vps39-like protein, partial [Tanacetum coccineum]
MGVHGSWKPAVSNAVLELRVFIPISLILGGELYNSVNIMVISVKAVWSSGTKHEYLLIKDIVGQSPYPLDSGTRETAAVLDMTLLQALLLLLTGQSTAYLDLLKSLNYCNVKI